MFEESTSNGRLKVLLSPTPTLWHFGYEVISNTTGITDWICIHFTWNSSWTLSLWFSAKAKRDGVASDHTSMASDMMLPQSLVSAFESAVLLLACTARSFSVINRCSDPMKQQLLARAPKARKDRELLESIGRALHQIGHNSRAFISKAEQDIMLMAHTDVDTETVSYESVGPEYILATIMTGLFNRAVRKDESVDSMYGAFYRKLVSINSVYVFFIN
jgi:hypothetical protein